MFFIVADKVVESKSIMMRWYFLFVSSFSALRSPLIESTPPSTLTRTSSLFTPGNSTLIVYSLSSSAMSTGGIHSVSINPSSPPSFFRGILRPKSEATLLCISCISRMGSQTEEPLSGFHFSSAFIVQFPFSAGSYPFSGSKPGSR
jgi:hypothetical protein